ncbi:ACSF2 [Cordylochernes scorpioides]|uniref:ACSF2 n=1 Tax=Cordylochernes scorpioides TaxID=51811 RepID=A0ABY6KYC1_9ARAC|nr:ACSF2 [Cordylochernes scorpioides]
MIEGFRLCLDNIYFRYGDKFYRQKDGTAMGCPTSMIIADIVMASVDKKAILIEGIKIWGRYIDDVFAVIRKENLDEIMVMLNNLEKGIEFTVETEREGFLSFLDVGLTRKEDGSILTSVFRKPTDCGIHLNFNSNNPMIHKRQVIKSLVERAKQYCHPPDYLPELLTKPRHDPSVHGNNYFLSPPLPVTSVKKPTTPSYGLMGNLPLAEKPFDVVALDSILGLGEYNSTKNCLHVIVDHHSRYIWAYPSKSQGKLMPAFYPEPYTIISIPSPQTIEIDKPCQPENKHATIVNISKVKLWDPVTEDNTEPPFPFQEEEDLEGCLGIEPNKQASTDSPQVLFSSIKEKKIQITPQSPWRNYCRFQENNKKVALEWDSTWRVSP